MAEEVLTGATAGVIGAGIFGVTAALELAAAGADVTLYEKQNRVLGGTTGGNVFRLHRGYHYPRDRGTAAECLDGFGSFVRYYPEAVARQVPHYYAIAGHGSLTTPDEFEKHCADLGLWYRPARPPGLIPGSTAACYEVIESYYDPAALRKTCLERLDRSPVRVEPGCTDSPAKIAAGHDVVVVAAYASLNRVLAGLGCPPVLLQHEACEVAVMHAPALRRYSLVVLDGPFVSLAPYGADRFLLYDVDHSVQAREVSTGSGTSVAGQKVSSAFGKMLASAARFVPVTGAAHEWSFFSDRVVLPGADATDARPTQVWRAGDRVVAVLSGKVCTAVDAARQVVAEVTR